MTWKKLIFFALILLISALACDLPLYAQDKGGEIAQVAPAATISATPTDVYVTMAPNATTTPTPFQPVPPTPTPLPTSTPTPVPTATLGINAPNAQLGSPRYPVNPGGPLPDGIVNILVMGSDSRGDGGFRTDVMILVSINRNKRAVSALSFPRDLYINIPGWMTNRLNTAMQVGGFPTMQATFQSNFGVKPDYYIMTNFDGFKGIVDSLHGIDVKARAELNDKCDLPWANGRGFCHIPANSTVPMDGQTALWYVRSRHSTSDFDRLRRAQEVLQAIFTRLMSLDAIGRAPEIFSIYHKTVETNLTLDQILPLIDVAREIMDNPGRIHRFALTPAEAMPYVTPEGAMVLWPNLQAIRAIVHEAVYQ